VLLPEFNRRFTLMNFQQLPDLIAFYSIRPKAGLSLGTRLENFADIYFDFNDPVRTNTTVNTLWQPTYTPGGVDTVFTSSQKWEVQTKMHIHPNPSKGLVEVFSLCSGTIQVDDTTGVLMEDRRADEGINAVHINTLPKGLYWIKQQTETGISSQKLVLE
jgi:hypothetical protein